MKNNDESFELALGKVSPEIRFTKEGESEALGIELLHVVANSDHAASQMGSCDRKTSGGSICKVGIYYLRTTQRLAFHNWTSHGAKHPANGDE